MEYLKILEKKPCSEWDENDIKSIYNIAILGPLKKLNTDNEIVKEKYFRAIDKSRELLLSFNLYLMEGISGKNKQYRKMIKNWSKKYDTNIIQKETETK
jgi:hypothetical protein